ncbi:MAG: tetratricopeptide repeat protein [Elusimicrobia bacterium]|nr:tetratricopeptide repeat protein [Elusimicrobiota bacterium]
MRGAPGTDPRKKTPPPGGGSLPAWLPAAAVAAVTFAVFSGVLRNGFVNWDDDFNLLLNNDYRGLGWAQLKWMFTTFHMGHYQPLSWLTLALDYKLWGMAPKGYHLTSLLLHCANAAVFYFVSLRLLGLAAPGRPDEKRGLLLCGAVFSALVFAVHPLRVEAVAWATERRDVLSGFFYLLTVLYYLKACSPGEDAAARPKRLALAAALFFVSLLSKGIGVSLPAVLIVLDVYPLRRLPAGAGQWPAPQYRAVWLEKIPFAVLSLAAGVVGLAAQITTGATLFLNIGEQPSLPVRVLQALYGAGFYVWKTLAPVNLLPLYERAYHSDALYWPIIITAAAVAAASVIFFLLRRRLPALLAVWGCYIATLLPVLQVVPFGPYIVADRYSYLACLGWALGAGWALSAGLRAAGASGAKVLLAAALCAVAGLGLLTRRQTGVWFSPETLWRHTLAGNPSSTIAHSNLGSILLDQQGKVEEAAGHFRLALRIRPDYAFVHYNYGNALCFQGRLDEAIEHYRRTLQLMPDYANAYFNLGNSFIRKNQPGAAIGYYREALRLKPDYAEAHSNLAVALMITGDRAGAVGHFRAALKINPGYARARQGLAQAGGGEYP